VRESAQQFGLTEVEQAEALAGRSFVASNGRLMCDECWGDRCDDPTHHRRGLPEGHPGTCPFCKGKVWLDEPAAPRDEASLILQGRAFS
jgi:hypothetical protein